MPGDGDDQPRPSRGASDPPSGPGQPGRTPPARRRGRGEDEEHDTGQRRPGARPSGRLAEGARRPAGAKDDRSPAKPARRREGAGPAPVRKARPADAPTRRSTSSTTGSRRAAPERAPSRSGGAAKGPAKRPPGTGGPAGGGATRPPAERPGKGAAKGPATPPPGTGGPAKRPSGTGAAKGAAKGPAKRPSGTGAAKGAAKGPAKRPSGTGAAKGAASKGAAKRPLGTGGPAKRPSGTGAAKGAASKGAAKRPSGTGAAKGAASKGAATRPPAERPAKGAAPRPGSADDGGPPTQALDPGDLAEVDGGRELGPAAMATGSAPVAGTAPVVAPDDPSIPLGPVAPDELEAPTELAPGSEVPPGYRLDRKGQPKKLRGKRKRIHKARQRPPSRLLNHYDVQGPHIRLGFLWFFGLVLTIGIETSSEVPGLALVYGAAAGFGGWQAAREWCKRTPGRAVPWAAAASGLAIGLAAAAGPAAVGVAALAAVPLGLAATAADPEARAGLLANAGLTIQCGLFVGLAAAAPMLAWRVEPAAAISLIVLVSAYEVGDYVVGSGSLNAVEGPLAGIAAMATIMLALYAVQLPPIDGSSVVVYAVIVAVGCPLSQIVGSAVLPWSDAAAPALRRIDSLMVTGPAWVVAVWLQEGLL